MYSPELSSITSNRPPISARLLGWIRHEHPLNTTCSTQGQSNSFDESFEVDWVPFEGLETTVRRAELVDSFRTVAKTKAKCTCGTEKVSKPTLIRFLLTEECKRSMGGRPHRTHRYIDLPMAKVSSSAIDVGSLIRMAYERTIIKNEGEEWTCTAKRANGELCRAEVDCYAGNTMIEDEGEPLTEFAIEFHGSSDSATERQRLLRFPTNSPSIQETQQCVTLVLRQRLPADNSSGQNDEALQPHEEKLQDIIRWNNGVEKEDPPSEVGAMIRHSPGAIQRSRRTVPDFPPERRGNRRSSHTADSRPQVYAALSDLEVIDMTESPEEYEEYDGQEEADRRRRSEQAGIRAGIQEAAQDAAQARDLNKRLKRRFKAHPRHPPSIPHRRGSVSMEDRCFPTVAPHDPNMAPTYGSVDSQHPQQALDGYPSHSANSMYSYDGSNYSYSTRAASPFTNRSKSPEIIRQPPYATGLGSTFPGSLPNRSFTMPPPRNAIFVNPNTLEFVTSGPVPPRSHGQGSGYPGTPYSTSPIQRRVSVRPPSAHQGLPFRPPPPPPPPAPPGYGLHRSGTL